MRHNLRTKEKVRALRKRGYSLGQIYKETNIPPTTIRLWIKDIRLSDEQLSLLKDRTQQALQEGRIRSQKNQKELRFKEETTLEKKGIKNIGKLSKRDFLIAGASLYWAEGFKNKHEHRLGFCNSDPDMIRFYLKWIGLLGVDQKDLVARVTLNDSYKEKTEEIENYWSQVTKIPKSQFTKTFYQKTIWKKQFNTENYHGVLRIHVAGSLSQLFLMRGWIKGLKLNSGTV